LFVLLENTQQNTEFVVKSGQIVFTLFLILFVGFRLVGADYGNYEVMYQNSENTSSYIELFFSYTMKLFNRWHLAFPIYTCAIAALSIFLKIYILKKYSPYFFLSIVIGLPVVFIGDMGQMRFALAIATLLLSIPYCMNRDPVRFGLIVLAATFMHVSAIVFVIAYFLLPLNMNYYYMLLIWLGCFILSRIMDNTIIGDFIDTFAENSMVDVKMSNYLNDENRVYTGEVEYTLQGVLFRLLTLGLIYYVSTDQDRLKSFFINTYFVGNCLFFLFSFNEIMALRMSLYFTCIEIIAIPFVLYEIKERFTFWTLLSVYVLRSFYQFYILIFVQFPDAYLPYKNALINLW
jgi:hypothetical protein